MIDNAQDSHDAIATAARNRQADLNAKREEMRKNMTPAELAKLDAIEQACAVLEAQQVPFLLWASSDDATKLEAPHMRGWFQFNRMSYVEPRYSKDYHDDAKVNAWSLQSHDVAHQSYLTPPGWAFVLHNAEGKAIAAWMDGRRVEGKAPEDGRS